jgi:hypothetical protein
MITGDFRGPRLGISGDSISILQDFRGQYIYS